MGDRDRACRGCRFYDDTDAKGGFGECRRHAPRAHVSVSLDDPMDPTAVWPTTVADGWCGEFEERRQ